MPRASATSALESGRLSHEQHAWAEAHEQLTRADEEEPLGADDLELLATAAYMLGRDEEYVSVLERAHQAHVAERGRSPGRPGRGLAGFPARPSR